MRTSRSHTEDLLDEALMETFPASDPIAVESSEEMPSRIKEENVRLKRAYESPSRSDGTRVLVDRLWPRGVKKTEARIDEWVKEIAPTTELRKWFGHDPARWSEFRRRYRVEVMQHPDELERLRALARQGPLTLVFSAHDEAHNDAVVLKELLIGESSGADR